MNQINFFISFINAHFDFVIYLEKSWIWLNGMIKSHKGSEISTICPIQQNQKVE